MGETLSTGDIRAILFSGNEDTRKKFLQHWGSEIDSFVSQIKGAQIKGDGLLFL